MTTTIVSSHSDWTPVEINIKFETREQLAALLDIYGSTIHVAAHMTSGDVAHATEFAKTMTQSTFSDALCETMSYDVWRELVSIVDQGQ